VMALQMAGVGIAAESALLVRLGRGKSRLRRRVVSGRAGTGGSAKRRAWAGRALGVAKLLQVINSRGNGSGLRSGHVERLGALRLVRRRAAGKGIVDPAESGSAQALLLNRLARGATAIIAEAGGGTALAMESRLSKGAGRRGCVSVGALGSDSVLVRLVSHSTLAVRGSVCTLVVALVSHVGRIVGVVVVRVAVGVLLSLCLVGLCLAGLTGLGLGRGLSRGGSARDLLSTGSGTVARLSVLAAALRVLAESLVLGGVVPAKGLLLLSRQVLLLALRALLSKVLVVVVVRIAALGIVCIGGEVTRGRCVSSGGLLGLRLRRRHLALEAAVKLTLRGRDRSLLMGKRRFIGLRGCERGWLLRSLAKSGILLVVLRSRRLRSYIQLTNQRLIQQEIRPWRVKVDIHTRGGRRLGCWSSGSRDSYVVIVSMGG